MAQTRLPGWLAALVAFTLFGGSAYAAPAEGPPFTLKEVLSGKSGWLLDDAEAVLVVDVKAVLGVRPLAESGVAGLIAGWAIFSPLPEADFVRSLSGVVVSMSSVMDKEKGKARMVLFGDFDVRKLTAALKKVEGVEHTREGKIDLFAYKTPNDQKLYGAFVGKTAIVVTNTKELTLALAKDGPPKASRQGEEMLAALKRLTGEECVALALPVSAELKKQAVANPAVAAALKSLTSLSVTLTDGTAVELAVTGHTTDAASAKKLTNQLTGLKALGDAFLGMMDNVPQIYKDLFDAITIDNTRATVKVGLKITTKDFKALMKERGIR